MLYLLYFVRQFSSLAIFTSDFIGSEILHNIMCFDCQVNSRIRIGFLRKGRAEVAVSDLLNKSKLETKILVHPATLTEPQ